MGDESRRPSDFNFNPQLINERTEIVGEIISTGNNNSRRPSPTTLMVPIGDQITGNGNSKAIKAKKFLSSSTDNNTSQQCFV